jgi:HAD superfamily hydrolase (TIGR01509 family)
VFDLDGLLVDSAAAWLTALEATAAALGGKLTPARLEQLAGCSVETSARQLVRWYGAKTQLRSTTAMLRGSLDGATRTVGAPPLPGARELVAALAGKLPMAVATNSPSQAAARMLRGAGLASFFSVVVTADDAVPKPSPDLYLLACDRLGVRPERSLAIEDSAVGAAGALAAGMGLALVGAGADRVAESLGLGSGGTRETPRTHGTSATREAPESPETQTYADLADQRLFDWICDAVGVGC